MNKYIVLAICGCMFYINGYSQTKNMEQLLKEIEQNNKELKGFESFIKSQKLENKSSNNLPNPQFSGYYLPFDGNATGSYTEYEISQSFEFPTVYAARGKWNETKTQQLASAYSKKRQEVLLNAKNLLLERALLQKQKSIEIDRRVQSKLVFDQIKVLHNKGQVGLLDLNKAKIAWIQEQFVVEQIESELQILISHLNILNGGNPVNGISNQIDSLIEMGTKESLWQEKLIREPVLQELKANEARSLQRIKLEKSKVLPNLAIGYNHQGEGSNNYSGFYGGISIPLWNSKNKVKAAETNYNYQQSFTELKTAKLYTQFEEMHTRYELMLVKYKEYQTTLGSLNSEELLFKAYMLGEYSFMNYYVELQFYRNASDKMLQMEKELQLLQAHLLKHQL